MKKRVIYIVSLLISLCLGLFIGYFVSIQGKGDVQTSGDTVVIKDGNYSVNADWDWKTLIVNGNTWVLDDKREYTVSETTNNIIILKGNNLESLSLFEIRKNKEEIELRSYTKNGISEKPVAVLTKNG